MRTDELYSKLHALAFVENYYPVNKQREGGKVEQVLKIYDEEGKLAEINLSEPYMLRTTYSRFQNRNAVEKQALLKILVDYANTPISQRQSNLYFAYYNDLNNMAHFIKRLPNNRLTDDTIPMAYFKTMTDQQIQSYLFNAAEFEDFPKDYRPRYTPDSFVKVVPYEEMMDKIYDRYTSKPQLVETNENSKDNTEDNKESKS